tara:strand:- start:130 stop:669 length:540 start_codon:yes stop_codon:yes gene_type:complete
MIKLKDIINEDIFRTSLKLKPHDKLLSSAVIQFMQDKFGFSAKIIIKKKSNNSLFGDISLNNNSVINNKFYLHYNPNQSYPLQIKSMIHELTHVKQVSKKELLPSNDYKSILWKGKLGITTVDYNKIVKQKDITSYKKLKWEIEAYSNMETLYKPFLNSKYWKSLKGKDTTMDFIIDNI